MRSFLVCFIFVSLNVLADCDPHELRFERGTSVGIGLGSGRNAAATAITVNLPVHINGEWACYHQKSSFNVETVRTRHSAGRAYKIAPPEVKFENIPEPRTVTYLRLGFTPQNRAHNLTLMSFVCSGETPIGSETFTDSFQNIDTGHRREARVNSFIATGVAARNLEAHRSALSSPVYLLFTELYRAHTGKVPAQERQSNVFVPAVVSGLSVKVTDRGTSSLYTDYYSRTGSTVNGCSREFEEAMREYVLSETDAPVRVRKKGKHFELTLLQ